MQATDYKRQPPLHRELAMSLDRVQQPDLVRINQVANRLLSLLSARASAFIMAGPMVFTDWEGRASNEQTASVVSPPLISACPPSNDEYALGDPHLHAA